MATRLLGEIVSVKAFELIDGSPGGYQFQGIDDAQADLWGLRAKLIERIRGALSVSYLRERRGALHIEDLSVGGQITSGLDDDGYPSPVLVIDGREISWEDFGWTLTAFEIWQSSSSSSTEASPSDDGSPDLLSTLQRRDHLLHCPIRPYEFAAHPRRPLVQPLRRRQGVGVHHVGSTSPQPGLQILLRHPH